MRLPFLRSAGRLSAVSEAIGGLNRTPDWRGAALWDGDGLTGGADGLTQRGEMRELGRFGSPQGMLATPWGLLVLAGGKAMLDGAELADVAPGAKRLALLGSRALVFPDKLWIDLESGASGPMELTCAAENVTVSGGSLTAANAAWPFAAGDGVTIEAGSEHPENAQTLIVRGVEGGSLLFDDNVFTPCAEARVTVTRRVPDLEVVCQHNNRLWGCAGDTIYGSKLGDPLNFFVYDGLATDAYALKTEAGGFTACTGHGTHVVFFREDDCCKLYGTRPANYQLTTSRIPGVRAGCGATLVCESDDLYYLGRDGFYAYSGGAPELLSRELPQLGAACACGAARRGRYYLCLPDRVLEYDLERRRWLPWGRERAVACARSGGALLMLCEDGALLSPTEDGPVGRWQAQFRPFRDGPARYRSGCSLVLDADPAPGAWLAVDVRDGGVWRQAALFGGGCRGVRPVALPPNRTGALELRLRGEGRCPIRAIERIFRLGSDAV